jgi:hypothetical protein
LQTNWFDMYIKEYNEYIDKLVWYKRYTDLEPAQQLSYDPLFILLFKWPTFQMTHFSYDFSYDPLSIRPIFHMTFCMTHFSYYPLFIFPTFHITSYDPFFIWHATLIHCECYKETWDNGCEVYYTMSTICAWNFHCLQETKPVFQNWP